MLDMISARVRTKASSSPPLPPIRRRSVRISASPEDEDALLCARYEAEQALRANAESATGCDGGEGALSPLGCRW